jgi:hypothetical protein
VTEVATLILLALITALLLALLVAVRGLIMRLDRWLEGWSQLPRWGTEYTARETLKAAQEIAHMMAVRHKADRQNTPPQN